MRLYLLALDVLTDFSILDKIVISTTDTHTDFLTEWHDRWQVTSRDAVASQNRTLKTTKKWKHSPVEDQLRH